MGRKQVSRVYLKGTNEKIIVSLERGIAARQAMKAVAEGRGGIWTVPELNNRVVDAKMIGDVSDVWIEDVQMILGEQVANARRIQAKSNPVEPSAVSPGYIKFLLAERRFKRRFGGKPRPLTEAQEIIISEIEEREAYESQNR